MPQQGTEERKEGGLFRAVCLLLMLATSGLSVATLIAQAARWHWVFELSSHFQGQYLAGLTCCCILLFVVGRWKWASAALVAWAANAWVVAPAYLPISQPAVSYASSFRAVSMNVLANNRQRSPAESFLADISADVVSVQEVSPEWGRWLAQLPEFPHHKIVPQAGAFGIALLSRHPLRNVREVALGDAVPCIVAEVELPDGGQVTVIATHALPPIGAHYATLRNRQLSELAQLVRAQSSPVVVLGDLNTTPYSPYFRDLLRDGELRDSRAGRGVQASWPTTLPVLVLPIDHCLVTRNVAVLDRRIERDIGSDHRPVVVDLQVPRP